MPQYKLISWNVNGLRAILKKNFWEIIEDINPDIIALQETKADDTVMQSNIFNNKFSYNWHSHKIKKGYSGVATLSKKAFLNTIKGFNIEEFDIEGRVLYTKFPEFTLLNIYFPSGSQGLERIKYKLKFYDAFFDYIKDLEIKGEKLIICGDFNTAHNEIDLHDPIRNINTSGFLKEERIYLDRLLEKGFIDSFRYFYPEKISYTWWDMRTRARDRNRGWRLDYFFISKELINNLKSAFIFENIIGSDHCPYGIDLEF